LREEPVGERLHRLVHARASEPHDLLLVERADTIEDQPEGSCRRPLR
jgi:hypothetical protein